MYDVLDHLGVEYMRLDHQRLYGYLSGNRQILRSPNLQESFSYKPSENGFLPSYDALQIRFSKPRNCQRLWEFPASFGDAETMISLLSTEPGSASVMGLISDIENKVRLVIDEDVLKEEFVGCHPCVNTSSLRIKTKDLTDVVLPYLNHSFTVVNLFGEV